jgi:hypothetical protein
VPRLLIDLLIVILLDAILPNSDPMALTLKFCSGDAALNVILLNAVRLNVTLLSFILLNVTLMIVILLDNFNLNASQPNSSLQIVIWTNPNLLNFIKVYVTIVNVIMVNVIIVNVIMVSDVLLTDVSVNVILDDVILISVIPANVIL